MSKKKPASVNIVKLTEKCPDRHKKRKYCKTDRKLSRKEPASVNCVKVTENCLERNQKV